MKKVHTVIQILSITIKKLKNSVPQVRLKCKIYNSYQHWYEYIGMHYDNPDFMIYLENCTKKGARRSLRSRRLAKRPCVNYFNIASPLLGPRCLLTDLHFFNFLSWWETFRHFKIFGKILFWTQVATSQLSLYNLNFFRLIIFTL